MLYKTRIATDNAFLNSLINWFFLAIKCEKKYYFLYVILKLLFYSTNDPNAKTYGKAGHHNNT